MADPHSPQRCRRSLAALLSLLIACGPLLTPAYAAGLIPLANEPIGTQNNAPPAIVLTVDDSSSMLSDWLPEAVARDDFDINYFCRDGVGAMTSVCGSTGASNSFGTAPDQFYSPGFTAQQFGYPFPLTTGNVGPAAAQPYDPSGPGAGCFQGPAFVPPTCYHGVDPTLGGSQPNGIGNFPIPDPNDPTSPPVGWPLAGSTPYTSPVNPEPLFNLPYANAAPYGVYPYWQLWPAPVHNAAVNALYYNPQLTYEPPVDSTGASYPQMNAANTATWTQVPADPWAATVININLTSLVTVGVWCNSDWSMGAVTVVNGVLTIDPTQCRRNGTAAAAAGSGGGTDGQDYTYPWAPPGFVPSASPGDTFIPNGTSPYVRAPSTLLSYAAQKVNLNPTGLDALSINTTNWNATSQDAKYFYENENILWCDPSSASWPGQNSTTHVPCTNIVNPTTCNGVQPQVCNLQTQTCNAQTQVCNGAVTQVCNTSAQTCVGVQTQTCTGEQTQTCSGSQTQTCVGEQTQTCNDQPQTCTGVVAGVCNGAQTQTCNGAVTQTCSAQTQTCNGAITQTCSAQTQTCNLQTQTCAGVQTQTCGLQTQTCVGNTQVCNLSSQTCNGVQNQVCNLPGTQTCQPPVCTTTYSPPGCNLLPPDPENPCTGTSNCAPPVCTPNPGTCSLQPTVSCTSNANCPTLPGTCNVGGQSCLTSSACPQVGTCSISGTSCTSNSQCLLAGGHCSIQTGTTCQQNTDCVQAGYCSIQTGTICTSNSNCPNISGHCNIQTGTTCLLNTDCVQAGYCSIQTGTVCTSNGNCPTIAGVCSTQTGTSCTTAANCPVIAGHCSIQTGTSCTTNANCPTVAGHCNVQTGTSCTTAANCPVVPGTCSVQTTTSCTTNANCPTVAGLCNNGTTSCTTTANCPAFGGHCSVQTGTSCTTNANCTTVPGNCSVQTGTSCTSAANCPIVPGHCSVQTGTSCTANSGCATVAGHCTVQTGTSCTSNANCPTVAGHCTVQTGTSCTANSGCTSPIPGHCSIQTGTSCQVNTDCVPAGFCSIQTTTACTTNANCPTVAGTCSIQTGTSCTSNGNCPTIAGNCNIQTGTSCTTAGNCPQAGYCSVQSSTVCTSNANCPTVAGTCQVGGASCLSNSNCPLTGTCSGFPSLTCTSSLSCPFVTLPASGVTCSTTGVGGVPTADLRQDAENNGVVCRRNNKAYPQLSLPLAGVIPAVAANGYNYPNDYFPGGAGGHYTTPVTGGTGADACTVTPHFVSVPRHYWNTSVEWCTAAIVLAGDKWLGYGTGLDSDGSCQPGYDATHIYPRFYQYGPTSYVDNYANAAFQRVDLDITQQATASYTTTWVDASGTQQSITRTFAEEMTNYANWYAYYRTRVQAVKTVTSLVFNQLDNTFNVGFATLSNGVATTPQAPLLPQSDPATFVNVAPFNAAQKAAWFQQLFGITIPLGLETPTLDAMTRVGDYFLHGSSAVFPGATNPITLSCQKNWHILFTDGFVNQASAPTTAGDQDLTVPLYPDYNGNPGTNPIAGLVPGQAWPHPYQEDPNNPDANGQADYAMYYWVQDMRPLSPLDPTSPNNVPTSSTDPADWQHLNFAALALGTHGKLNATNPSLTLNQLAAGTLQWPAVIPNVWHPDASGVDDLWHAAVNGRGQFVNAASAAQLQLGMGQILENITNQAGSRAAAGFSTNTITATNNSIYQVSFQPGWGGDVVKIPVDPVTGLGGAPVWDAAAQLGTQLLIAAPGDTPWFTNRKVFTVNDANQAVPFLWANLSAVEQNSLAPGLPATGQQILAYLRGDPTNEGISVGQFRVRASVASGEDFLGDIVDSSALYVAAAQRRLPRRQRSRLLGLRREQVRTPHDGVLRRQRRHAPRHHRRHRQRGLVLHAARPVPGGRHRAGRAVLPGRRPAAVPPPLLRRFDAAGGRCRLRQPELA